MNKHILIGNVGKDADEHTFQNGDKQFSFSIATTDKWTDKSTGEMKESTQWHNIVMGDRFKKVAQYVKKGGKVAVEGKVKHRSYESDGVTKYVTEVHVNELVLLGGKNDSQNQSELSVPSEPRRDNRTHLTPETMEEGDGLPF